MKFSFFPLTDTQVQIRKKAWDGLMGKRAFGWAAIERCPKPDLKQLSLHFLKVEEIPLFGPVGSKPEWDAYIRQQVHNMHLSALSRYEDDAYPAIAIPRSVHGQSQSFAQIFGCELILQDTPSSLYYSIPWIKSPQDLCDLKLSPIEQCLTGQAIEFAAYARAVTSGALAIRNPVITGPIDSANYILGSMQLMRWIYDEPQALHELLEIITEIIIELIHKLQNAAGGTLCPDHCVCLPQGFALCSEVRHLLSVSMYEEFESPYLRQIGLQCGPYMIHSCGTWERMLPIDMKDENLIMVHFQTKEMNLKKVYDYTQGKLSLFVGESINLSEEYIWSNKADFYRYLMSAFPEAIPLSFAINDMHSYLQVQEELQNGTASMFKWRIMNMKAGGQ